MQEDVSSFIALSEDMAASLALLHAPDTEETEESDDSWQLLRWLENLPSIDEALDEWLEGAENIAKAESLGTLVKIFVRKFKRARRKKPELKADDALRAAEAMTYAVTEQALVLLPDNDPRIAMLETRIEKFSPQAELLQAQSVRHAVESVAMIVGAKPTPERLADLGARMSITAQKLRSVDSMEPPAREESIELAREILRRLKNLGFSDKPIKEMIDTGLPEEKAAFAKQISEMADMYKNLLQEAATLNPNILQDQAIREANQAVQTFTHAIRLMAAKEMPNSIATAQQISADAAHNPAEWDQLHHHTVGRLIKSMEGGLEKAANSIESEQEQQRNDAEQQAQEAAEQALHHAETHRKKKRKRRSGGGTRTASAKKQHKEKALHHNEAEDYVGKQGLFNRHAKTARGDAQHGMAALSAEALAAVKQLGGTLLNLGNQAKELAQNVTTNDKIVPDDKSVSQRVLEEQQRNSKNQGPRV